MVNVGSPPLGRRSIDVSHVGHGQRREPSPRAPRDRRFPCGTWSTSRALPSGAARSTLNVYGADSVAPAPPGGDHPAQGPAAPGRLVPSERSSTADAAAGPEARTAASKPGAEAL